MDKRYVEWGACLLNASKLYEARCYDGACDLLRRACELEQELHGGTLLVVRSNYLCYEDRSALSENLEYAMLKWADGLGVRTKADAVKAFEDMVASSPEYENIVTEVADKRKWYTIKQAAYYLFKAKEYAQQEYLGVVVYDMCYALLRYYAAVEDIPVNDDSISYEWVSELDLDDELVKSVCGLPSLGPTDIYTEADMRILVLKEYDSFISSEAEIARSYYPKSLSSEYTDVEIVEKFYSA